MKKEKHNKPVNLTPSTKKRLAGFGRFGETYDEIITRLMDFYEKKRPV